MDNYYFILRTHRPDMFLFASEQITRTTQQLFHKAKRAGEQPKPFEELSTLPWQYSAFKYGDDKQTLPSMIAYNDSLVIFEPNTMCYYLITQRKLIFEKMVNRDSFYVKVQSSRFLQRS